MQCPKYDDIRTVDYVYSPVLQNCVKGYASHTQCTP